MKSLFHTSLGHTLVNIIMVLYFIPLSQVLQVQSRTMATRFNCFIDYCTFSPFSRPKNGSTKKKQQSVTIRAPPSTSNPSSSLKKDGGKNALPPGLWTPANPIMYADTPSGANHYAKLLSPDPTDPSYMNFRPNGPNPGTPAGFVLPLRIVVLQALQYDDN